MYRYGLKEEVKDELIRYRALVDIYEALIEASISIDDKLYERRIERKYDNKGRSFTSDRQPNIRRRV